MSEPINELSKKTLGDYIRKASDDKARGQSVVDSKVKFAKSHGRRNPNRVEGYRKVKTQLDNRTKGINLAVNRLTKEEVLDESEIELLDSLTEEEFEQLDELSKKTLNSYKKRIDANWREKFNSLTNAAYQATDPIPGGYRSSRDGPNADKEKSERLFTKAFHRYYSRKMADKKITALENNKKGIPSRFPVKVPATDESIQEENEMPTFKDLLALSVEGEAFDFTNAIKDVLTAKAQEVVQSLAEPEVTEEGLSDDELAFIAENITEEEFEQLDELSKETLQSYRSKASAQRNAPLGRGRVPLKVAALKSKRSKGIDAATKKISAIGEKEWAAKEKMHTDHIAHAHASVEKIVGQHGYQKVGENEKRVTYVKHLPEVAHTLTLIHHKPGSEENPSRHSKDHIFSMSSSTGWQDSNNDRHYVGTPGKSNYGWGRAHANSKADVEKNMHDQIQKHTDYHMRKGLEESVNEE